MENSKMFEMIKGATKNQGLYAVNFMSFVEMIKNISIQNFVRDVLVNHTPDYFWITPASKSGKHHNEDECVEGGLLVHIKRATNMAIVLMRGIGWYDHQGKDIKEEKIEDHDIVLAAIILHDLLTAGFKGREKKDRDGNLSTDSMHPYYVREELRFKKTDKDIYFYKLPFFDKIMRAIEGHYGYWSVIPHTANLKDAQSVEFIVYMADYIASRKLDIWFNV
jgi:hypothetical protein